MTSSERTRSGEAWLGSVPSHWRLMPLGACFRERKETVSDQDFPPLSVTKVGVVPQLADVAKTANNDARKLVRAGDFVINSRSDRKGSSGLSDRDGSVSVVYTVLVPDAALDPRFVHYVLRSTAFQEEFYRWGNGIVADLWSTRYSAMKQIVMAIPPLEEQRAIADFLDRETAQIDTLIAKQQRLIATLRERRSSVISEVVASGATSIVPLRRLADVVDCAHVTADFVDDDERYPVASIGECQGRYVDLSRCKYTTKDFFELLRAGGRAPRAGDLLFVRNASVGLVSSVAARTPEFAVGQETVLLRRKGETDSDFLRYALSSALVKFEIESAMIGSTFKRINVSAIRGLPIPIVPGKEQRRRARELDQQTAAIDTLIEKSERLIELSQERRSALITAAVTGQIDVRKAA